MPWRQATPGRQRTRALAGLAVGLGTGLLGAGASWTSGQSDAMALAERARLTVQAFARHPDFASMRPALARARAVLVFPQVLKAGFLIGGSGGTGVLMVRAADTGHRIGTASYTMGGASVVDAKTQGAFAVLAVDGSVLDVRDTLNAADDGLAGTPADSLVRQAVSRAESAGLRGGLADASR